MSAFLMVLALVIACIVLAQQFVILHRQNKQLMAYSYYVDGFFAAIKTVKDAVDKINTAFVQHAVDTIQENVKQEQFRNRYYKRKSKTEPAQPVIGHPSTDPEVQDART